MPHEFQEDMSRAPKLRRNLRRKSTSSSSGSALPLMIESGEHETSLAMWVEENQDIWESGLEENGAVLLRGFKLDGIEQFSQLIPDLCGESIDHYGDLPHTDVEKGVYNTSPYPADESILLHGEGAHLSTWPLRMCFLCETAPASGGETTLLDSHTMWELLDPELREDLESKGISYIRNFHPKIDRSWQSVFQTTERATVEKVCSDSGIHCEWTGDDSLRTIMTVPARTPGGSNGDLLFFHQLLLFHPMGLPEEVRKSLQSIFAPEEMPRHAKFGDGSPIPVDRITRFKTACEERSVGIPWQAGDMVLVDNMRVAHGRRPYSGDRKILVGMGGIGRRS